MYYILSKKMELDRREKHKKYKEHINLTSNIYPELISLFRKNNVKLGNISYDFDDVISMNNNYQLILTKEQTKDKVVSLYPLLSVGLAELISRYKMDLESNFSLKNEDLIDTLKDINKLWYDFDVQKLINSSMCVKTGCFNIKNIKKSIEEKIRIDKKSDKLSITNHKNTEPLNYFGYNIKDDMTFTQTGLTSHLLICMNQIRQTMPNEFSPYIKELVITLNSLCIIDTKSYIQVLFDWFLMLAPFVFFVPEYKNNYLMERLHEQFAEKSPCLQKFVKALRDTKGIKIKKEDNTEYYITDTTILSVNMLLLFYANLMKKCSSISNNQDMVKNIDFAIEYYIKNIKESLKNDFVGRYYKFKPTNFNINIDDVFTFDLRGENYKEKIPKYRMEDKQVLQKMYNIPVLNNYTPDILYCSLNDLIRFMGNIILNMSITSTRIFNDKLQKKTEEIIKNKNKEIDEFKQNYNSFIEEKIKKEYNNKTEELNNKIKDLENQIHNKNTIIETLYKDYDELMNNLENVYSDYSETEIINKQNELGLDYCLSFINSFKILFVGRKDNFTKILKDNGFTNFIHFESTSDIPKTPPQCDFICFNTKYMSHSLVNTIKSLYKNKEIINFNGMNITSLIYVCYDFLDKYCSKDL